MKNLMKKIVISIVGLSMVVMMAPGVAQGVTAEELQAQINALLANLATLQAQLQALTGAPAAVSCTFTRNLYPGVSGADVNCLQRYLNASGHTLAASGVGSAGNETQYFGSLTQAAVKKWQDANSVAYGAYGGYFGPVSRAKYTALIPPVPPPVACTTDANCATGQVCTAGVCVTPPPVACTTDADCAAGKVCTAGACVTPVVTPSEGSFTVTISAAPSNKTYDAGVDRDVYGIDVRAYGSDITIGRIDPQVTVMNAVTSTTYNPGTFITAISVYDGATLVKKVENPTFTLDSAGLWFTQITGLTAVVAKDTTKTLTVKFSTVTAIDQNRTVTVRIYANGIRGTDTLGLSRYDTLTTVRTHTFQVAGQAVLTGTAVTDNPVSQNWENNVTTGSLNIPLVKFNLKATIGDAVLTRLTVNMASAIAASNILPSVVRLYDGDTEVTSADPSSGVATFENFSLLVGKDVTKAMTVKGDFPTLETAEPVTNGNVAQAAVAATGATSVFLRADGSIVPTTITGGVAGNNQYLFRQGVKLTFLSGTASHTNLGLDSDVATGVLKFKVEPFGGTMTRFRFASAASATTTVVVYAYQDGTIVTTGQTRSIIHSPNVDVPDGSSADVTVSQSIEDKASSTTGYIRFKIDYISWTVGAVSADQGNIINMLDNWITPDVLLP